MGTLLSPPSLTVCFPKSLSFSTSAAWSAAHGSTANIFMCPPEYRNKRCLPELFKMETDDCVKQEMKAFKSTRIKRQGIPAKIHTQQYPVWIWFWIYFWSGNWIRFQGVVGMGILQFSFKLRFNMGTFSETGFKYPPIWIQTRLKLGTFFWPPSETGFKYTPTPVWPHPCLTPPRGKKIDSNCAPSPDAGKMNLNTTPFEFTDIPWWLHEACFTSRKLVLHA